MPARTQFASPDARHGWLVAVLPSGARRFRVRDPGLAQSLIAAGAKLVEESPDVEIARSCALAGDAPVAIIALQSLEPASSSRIVRGAQRLVRSGAIRLRSAAARRALRRHGYGVRRLIAWERTEPLREGGANPRRRVPLAHRFPLNTVVFGCRGDLPTSMLETALVAAGRGGPRTAEHAPVVGSSGVIVVMLGSAVLRVAIGPARERLDAHGHALRTLLDARPDPAVAARVPASLQRGETGLAIWWLEQRLAGETPRPPLAERLLEDCLDFLVALHGAGRRTAAAPLPLSRSAHVVAAECPAETRRALDEIAARLDRELAALPRGFAHGDFWSGNVLAEDGRLRGVVDWSAAGPGRLPLLDLLHLQISAVRERSGLRLGPALLRYAADQLPGDDVISAYCERLGLTLAGRELRGLLAAYWLEALARELLDNGRGPQQLVDATWLDENVDLVLNALEPSLARG
jgi:aminoglycoside phosphotransferase (APT) family kinase protein